MRLLSAWTLGLLVGCFQRQEPGGDRVVCGDTAAEDSGAPPGEDDTAGDDADTGVDDGNHRVDGLSASELSDETSAETYGLSGVGGDGWIAVSHRGIMAPCGSRWWIDVSFDKLAADATYTASKGSPDGECAWELTYLLLGLESGTWTLDAQGEQATVRVY